MPTYLMAYFFFDHGINNNLQLHIQEHRLYNMNSAIPNIPASRPRPGPVGRWYVFFPALYKTNMTDHTLGTSL